MIPLPWRPSAARVRRPSCVNRLCTTTLLHVRCARATIAFDYRLDEEQLHPVERVMMQFTANMMAAGGEPWCSSCTRQCMVELMDGAGFDVEEDLGPAELNARYFSGRRDGLQIAGGGFRCVSAIKR